MLNVVNDAMYLSRRLQKHHKSCCVKDYRFSPGARFSNAPSTFWVRNAIFSSSVSKNGEVYTPEISRMKGTSVHIKNM